MRFRKYINLFSGMVLALSCIAQNNTIEIPPGVIVDHLPKETGRYIGSPGICILPNGDYLASHDEFGPKTTEFYSAVTRIFQSSDRGKSWRYLASIQNQFWSNLFVHNGDIYIMGTNKHHGNFSIRKSIDNGKTWTIPYNKQTGLLLEGEYHTAPVPVLIYNGRIWRALEYATAPTIDWGKRYSAMVISAPVGSDLLNTDNWTISDHLPYDSTYLSGKFGGWLEGNIVAGPEGRLFDILRVEVPQGCDEKIAMLEISDDGKIVSFNSSKGFIPFDGGSKKFTIRYDEKTKLYWTLANIVLPEFKSMKSSGIRNTVALRSSSDLKVWRTNKIVLQHPDPIYHAFQYPDWVFDGGDIIFVLRTAYGINDEKAENAHDANYFTFHRISNFRDN
jgi:hypothetical protein